MYKLSKQKGNNSQALNWKSIYARYLKLGLFIMQSKYELLRQLYAETILHNELQR